MGEKILLTGATGFIGKKVLKRLTKLYGRDQIVALSSGDVEEVRRINAKNYEFDNEYLTEEGCKDVEFIIHLGAWTPKNPQVVNDMVLSNSNIRNTAVLIKQDFPNLRKIIFASTIDVYGNYSAVIDENTITVPTTLYGWSKLYCEQMLKSFGKAENRLVQVLRIGHVYGEGEEKYSKAIPNMIRSCIKDEPIHIYGTGDDLRTFIYIDDIATAIVNSIETERTETINLVGSNPISINQLASEIKEVSEQNIEIVHHEGNGSRRDCIFDNTRLKESLLSNFTDFRTGLKAEFEYMRGLK